MSSRGRTERAKGDKGANKPSQTTQATSARGEATAAAQSRQSAVAAASRPLAALGPGGQHIMQPHGNYFEGITQDGRYLVRVDRATLMSAITPIASATGSRANATPQQVANPDYWKERASNRYSGVRVTKIKQIEQS